MGRTIKIVILLHDAKILSDRNLAVLVRQIFGNLSDHIQRVGNLVIRQMTLGVVHKLRLQILSIIDHLHTSVDIGQRLLKQMEPILNFQVPADGLELVILLHTQY